MTAETIELNLLSTTSVEDSDEQDFVQSQKPRLRNGYREAGSKRATPIDPGIILDGITDQTNGWPKAAAGELLVINSCGRTRIIKSVSEYFAWLHSFFDVDWLGAPGIRRDDFFEFCRVNCKQYVDVADHPHFPPIDGVLYEHDQMFPTDNGRLDQFLDFLNPATLHDRELIKAFLLTMFWGGEPGQRPAFLITTDDNGPNQGRGYGKTTLVAKCSELSGGTLCSSQSESIEGLKKRILSQANAEPRPRVIEFDNVKTRRFSSADLEAFVTARSISGHVMYRGNGAVPNHHTVAITINGASLSKDLAQRCVVIKLGKPEHSHSWLKNISDFIEEYKWDIINHIGHLLRSAGPELSDEGCTRWGLWERDVLMKVEDPLEVRELLVERQKEVDDDDANGAEFVKHLRETSYELQAWVMPHSELCSGVKRITHNKMRELLQEFLGDKIGKNVITKKVEALGLPCLHVHASTGKSRTWLFRKDGQPLTEEQIAACTNQQS